jgi:hypothetical protein
MLFNKKLIIFFTLQLIFQTNAFSSTFPRGCSITGFGYSDNYLILNEKGEQSFYMVQNRSDKTIELEHHETKDVFMSPKLHSKLEPQHWSAFASDEEGLYFKCFTQEGDSATIMNCADVLEVCQYPRVKFALSNMGNYWVSTNKDQGQVIKDAVAKGILLRW